MKYVTYEQLHIDSSAAETIFAAVVKCNPERILELANEPGFARGYHMNKNEWLTRALDGTVPFAMIEKLLDESFELTEEGTQWIPYT